MALSGLRVALQVVASLVGLVLVVGLLVFWPAGTLRWVRPWALMAVYAVYIVPTAVWLRRTRPTLLERRLKKWDPAAPLWDKVIMLIVASATVTACVVAGFDHGNQWSAMPAWVSWTALGAVALSLLGIVWVFATNPYALPAARLQPEYEQQVITGGPYRFVRHPMYSAALLHYVALPLALGSFWALVPAFVVAAALAIRTAKEDRMLRSSLPGYSDYARRTRFRLLPGIW